MIGNMSTEVVSIDFSVPALWRAWRHFRKGKKASAAIDTFTFYLEANLHELCHDLDRNRYRHGGYNTFEVTDSKRRRIMAAGIRDRVVHRLLYDYLVPIFDPRFIYDAWSCRKGKGLLAAIERAQELSRNYPHAWVWRADISKFFESVDRSVLWRLILRRVKNERALLLLHEVIFGACRHTHTHTHTETAAEFRSAT